MHCQCLDAVVTFMAARLWVNGGCGIIEPSSIIPAWGRRAGRSQLDVVTNWLLCYLTADPGGGECDRGYFVCILTASPVGLSL
jgi:hypothetical protein